MKRFAMSLVLACALCGTALAGDIPSTGINAEEAPIASETLRETRSMDFASESALNAILWAILSAF
jgi:hypothetical protein